MDTNYTGKLDDGRPFTFTAGATPVFKINGVEVWPNPPAPVDPLAGFTKVAKEGETYDLGAAIADVAYGVSGKYAFKTGVTGKIAFNNGVFGDPIVGAFKAGFVKITKPAPTPDPEPSKVPVFTGAVTDDSDPATLARELKSVGWQSIRLWQSYRVDSGDMDTGNFAKCVQHLNNGIMPRLCFTPDTNASRLPVHPAAAIAKIKNGLDKRVRINLGNEANLTEYWFNADWMGAARVNDKIAAELNAAGFSCGTQSQTGWFSDIAKNYGAIKAAGLHRNYKRVVGHIYSNRPLKTDPAVNKAQADVEAYNWLSDFEYALAEFAKVRDDWSKDLGFELELDIDEWGFGQYVPENAVIALLPKVYALFRKYRASDAYFIATLSYKKDAAGQWVPKPPHCNFAWIWDNKLGTTNTKLAAAVQKAIAG